VFLVSQSVHIFRQHKSSFCLKFKGMICVSLKRGELCKLINGETSHLRPLAFESVWHTVCRRSKPNANALLWKKHKSR